MRRDNLRRGEDLLLKVEDGEVVAIEGGADGGDAVGVSEADRCHRGISG